MPVFYLNLEKQESLTREPYASFLKKYDLIEQELNGEEIELRVGGKDETFTNGFYVDSYYYENPRLRFSFATVPNPDNHEETSTLVRACYSYEGDDCYDLQYHIQRAKDIKRRAPYYFLPGATHFEFSSQVDEEFKLQFDVLVADNEKVAEVCCLLISLIIAIFSQDN